MEIPTDATVEIVQETVTVTRDDIAVSVADSSQSVPARSLEERDKLFHQYLPLATKLARRRQLDMPKSVTHDEILSAARQGLLEAAAKFDEKVQPSFQIFAKYRILGAIDDYLRSCTWGGRNRRLQKWSLEVNVSPTGATTFSSLQDSLSRDESEYNGETEDFFAYVTSSAPPMVRQMFKLYFIDGMTMKEIGIVFSLSEARVSQLLTEYKRVIMNAWGGKEHELWQDLANDKTKVRRLTRDVASRLRPFAARSHEGE